MAKYLTNKETQATLEKIIIKAEKNLNLISPYLKLSNTLLARIKAAADKGVIVRFVYRKNEVNKSELDRLKTIKNVELKSTDDLHAKCYFNEKEMIITSLNLLETSEKNWEMGILINRTDDKEIFDAALRDCDTIYSDSYSLPMTVNNPNFKKTIAKSPTTTRGYCIRTGTQIPFNIERPLSNEAFQVWNQFGDPDYPENYCHFSGDESDGETSYDRPILHKHWKKAKEIHNL